MEDNIKHITNFSNKENKNEDKKPIIRAYLLKQHANKHKQQLLIDTLLIYRKLAKQISNHHWRLFFQDKQPFKDRLDIKFIENPLSERYKQTCQTQVIGTLHSYISNIQIRFKDKVLNSSLAENKDLRIKLLYINKYGKWMHSSVKMQKKDIEPEIIFLAKKIFKHLTKNHPSFKHYNMVLDKKIADVFPIQENKATSFDYWAHISTKNKGEKLYIPLQTNDYFDSIEGIFKNAIQVNYKDGCLEIRLIKQIEQKMMEYASEKLGVDIGTVVFIATEHGDLLGRQMMFFLKKQDSIIWHLAKNLKKQGIKLSDNKRYNRLNRKLREYLKNEIGRIINKMVQRYKPKKIKKEITNFQGSNIGRTNNRILNRFGKQIYENKMKSITEENGIELIGLPSYYTSQECPECHYTNKKNRSARKFKCKCCGLTMHADVVGGKNCSHRSSIEYKNKTKEETYQLLCEEHDRWLRQRRDSTAKDFSRAEKMSKLKEPIITQSTSKKVKVS